MRRVLLAFILAIAVGVPALRGAADDWPQFRGANAGVAADNPALPDTWSATENIAWKTPIAGIGWSSPIVWGDHVFVTSVVNTRETDAAPKPPFGGGQNVAKATSPLRWTLTDVDFNTGQVRWQRELVTTTPLEAKHFKNSYASETPVTDGERVFAYVGYIGLFAYDFTGRLVWKVDMPPVKTRNGWGTAASPVVHDGRVYIVNDNDTQSFIAAYDAKTGSRVWQINRDEGSNWTTPFVWANERRTEIVTTGSDKVRSYDLNGKLLWELTGMSTIAIPTPFAKHGLLYINSGYSGDQLRPVYAIRPGASGDISLKGEDRSNAFVVWSHPTLGSYNPSSIVVGDYYYTLYDRGFLTCHDARTGREIYGRQRISAEASGFSASPWSYNGKIFVLSEDGDTFVIQPGAEFKVVGKNSLDEMTLASPAVARGSLIIRSASNLYRIGKS